MSKKRVTTHQIKHDEFISTVSRIVLYLEERRKQVFLAVGLLVVLVFGIIGARAFLKTRSEQASYLLGSALQLYHLASSDSATGIADPDKLNKALEALGEIPDLYPFSRAARIARFYSGLCLLDLGRDEEAYTSLEAFLDRHPRAFNASQARLVLANLAGDRGDVEEARTWFLEAVGVDSPGLPKEEVLLEMGRFLEAVGRNEEAFEVYDRIIQEFPDSDFRYLAQQRFDALS